MNRKKLTFKAKDIYDNFKLNYKNNSALSGLNIFLSRTDFGSLSKIAFNQ